MEEYIQKLKEGGVGVMPTDTVYGIVGSALNPETVERIYAIKGRTTTKPFIILISGFEDLKKFNIELNPSVKNTLENLWPGPVTAILPCSGENWQYLHRGSLALAFRFPKNEKLISLLKQVGPLAAPSANPEGLPPARNIFQAREYFGDSVDFYANGGTVLGEPSTIVRMNQDGTVATVR